MHLVRISFLHIFVVHWERLVSHDFGNELVQRDRHRILSDLALDFYFKKGTNLIDGRFDESELELDRLSFQNDGTKLGGQDGQLWSRHLSSVSVIDKGDRRQVFAVTWHLFHLPSVPQSVFGEDRRTNVVSFG